MLRFRSVFSRVDGVFDIGSLLGYLLKGEIYLMVKERERGKSFGAINELLFTRYGYTLDTRTIRRLIKSKKGEG